MSVHGEFDRYLDATLRALRETSEAPYLTWAEETETRVSDPADELEERARRVLDGPLASALDANVPPPVSDAVSGLLAISRIILGR